MPGPRRPLATADVAELINLTSEEPDRSQIFDLVQSISADTCGWVLLTTLKYVEHENAVERIHSSDEVSHPIGGRKSLDKLVESHGGSSSSDVFLAGTKDDVRRAFYDHDSIFALGIGSILNAPITHADRRLGTLNFCGEEGMYGANEIQAAKILAGLLVPTLLSEV